MFVNEELAKKKLCPFCWMNPDFTIGDSYCEASKCMFWRWKVLPIGKKSIFGFCGLAGKPVEYEISGTEEKEAK